MPQAKRIKKKPLRKPKRKIKTSNVPWGLLLIILCSGVILGMLINGMQHQENGQGFGAGLKEIFKQEDPLVAAEDAEIVDLIEKKSSKKEYDFYELLPDIEKVMPDDLPEANAVRPDANLNYFLQAASFRQRADAEKLRGRLALKGFKSITQERKVEGDGVYYRVRLGPYENKRKAKTAKNRLKKIGVHPFVFTIKK